MCGVLLCLANYTSWIIRKRRFLTVINEHEKGVPEAPTNRIFVYHNYKLLVRHAPDGVTIIVIWKGMIINVNEVHMINITPHFISHLCFFISPIHLKFIYLFLVFFTERRAC